MYSKIKYRSSIAALLVFTCSILRTSAQKEGFVWHFGVEAGIEFSSGGPKLVPKSSMATSEGCASYSDANGNLLFYTNGGGRDPLQSGQTSGKIWNRNHEVMYGRRRIQRGAVVGHPAQTGGARALPVVYDGRSRVRHRRRGCGTTGRARAFLF
jgi:hypothetical protein